MLCKDEMTTSFIGKSGYRTPLNLVLSDESSEYAMTELVDMRFEGADKERLAGKCKGHFVTIAQRKIGKWNGAARIEGEVLEIHPLGFKAGDWLSTGKK